MKYCRYCHAMLKAQVFRYDDHTMRRYRCTGCGDTIATREDIVAEVDYTRFEREPVGLPVRIYRTENLCHGLQDLDPCRFRRMAEAVLDRKLVIKIIGGADEMPEMQCADALNENNKTDRQGARAGDAQNIPLRDMRSTLQEQRNNTRSQSA